MQVSPIQFRSLTQSFAAIRSLRHLVTLRSRGIGGYILLNEQMFLWYLRHEPNLHLNLDREYAATRARAITRRGLPKP